MEHSFITRPRLRMADPCTKFEVSSRSRRGDFTWGVKFQNESADSDRAPFRDGLTLAGWCLLPLTYRRNLKFLTTLITKIWEAMQIVQIGVVWGLRGHSRSWAMSPCNRAHTTSYSTSIETMRLSCTAFEIQPVICRKSPILTHLMCIWRPHGVISVEFRGYLWHQKARVPGLSCGAVCVILR